MKKLRIAVLLNKYKFCPSWNSWYVSSIIGSTQWCNLNQSCLLEFSFIIQCINAHNLRNVECCYEITKDRLRYIFWVKLHNIKGKVTFTSSKTYTTCALLNFEFNIESHGPPKLLDVSLRLPSSAPHSRLVPRRKRSLAATCDIWFSFLVHGFILEDWKTYTYQRGDRGASWRPDAAPGL